MKKLVLINAALAVILVGGCSGSSETCGAGTVDLNGTCVAVAVDAGPGIGCGAGTQLVNGQCVAVDAGPGVECGSGTVLVDGKCVAGTSTTIAVEMLGLGTGTITGQGVVCGDDRTCTTTVLEGTEVELTAVPDQGYAFVGWKGAGCSGTGTCKVTPSAFTSLKAGFGAATFWNGDGIHAARLTGGNAQALPVPGNPALSTEDGAYVVSPDGMTFAYGAPGGINGNWQIWVLDYWASESRLVAPASGWGAQGGAFSPDGKWLAVPTNGLVVMLADGTDSTQVGPQIRTDDCHNAWCATTRFVTWSPDSKRVAWVSGASLETDGTSDVYNNVWTANVDGTNPTRLTDFNSTSMMGNNPGVTGLDWSADGKKIAFVSSQDPGANRTGAIGVTVENLWTVDVSTKALFCVTNFTTEYRLDMATYARSGNSLVFTSTQDSSLGTGTAGRNLFTVVDDGTGLRALTASTSNNAFSGGHYWHPDGKTVLFESNMDPMDPTKVVNSGLGIWAVTLDSAAPKQVNYAEGTWDYSPHDNND